MITEINISEFRADLEAAVKSLESKYSVRIEFGPISYNEAILSSRMDAKTVVNGEVMVDPIVELNALRYLLRFGRKAEGKIIGAAVELDSGKRGKIVDFSNRKKNEPFTVEVDSKLYAIPLGVIKKFLPSD
ncbi:hypothetical protein [Leadbettera azotonutricia]|uniref:Uncharacterized protein n=1 Tax=Leadbettera azotonutricia (strain ATCC BAA-888 / DSM 13862 / ZAS-9) TaxID=545695 RepID=F5YEI0_LEAAZ|nr:hypothetical protein [Leadbettera azotonutricia]AEF82419.1 hypothetical protein TREAZ_2589 [Leadbettera azotonutricia ZAS-9]